MVHLEDALKSGAVAGLEATAAMSALMWGAQQAGIVGKQAPKQVVQGSLEAVGQPSLPEWTHNATTLVAHFAFGGAAGAIYGSLVERVGLDRAPALTGIGFGLGVRAAAYRVVFPVPHVMTPPERDRPGRVLTMIAAHAVYGAVLGGRTASPDRRLSPR